MSLIQAQIAQLNGIGRFISATGAAPTGTTFTLEFNT